MHSFKHMAIFFFLTAILASPHITSASLINAQVKGTVLNSTMNDPVGFDPMYAQVSDPGVEFERGFFQADFSANQLTFQNIASGGVGFVGSAIHRYIFSDIVLSKILQEITGVSIVENTFPSYIEVSATPEEVVFRFEGQDFVPKGARAVLNYSFQTIPEPSSFAMILIGAGAIFQVRRMRRT